MGSIQPIQWRSSCFHGCVSHCAFFLLFTDAISLARLPFFLIYIFSPSFTGASTSPSVPIAHRYTAGYYLTSSIHALPFSAPPSFVLKHPTRLPRPTPSFLTRPFVLLFCIDLLLVARQPSDAGSDTYIQNCLFLRLGEPVGCILLRRK